MASYLSSYAHIQEATTPLATLGLADNVIHSAADIKSAHRRLALRLHPDKCPVTELLGLHQTLFLKVQQAYEDLQKKLDEGFVDASGEVRVASLLAEAPSALHARVLDFKQALKDERDSICAAKHAEEENQAARSARTAAARAHTKEGRDRHFGIKDKERQHRPSLEKKHRNKLMRAGLQKSLSIRSRSGSGIENTEPYEAQFEMRPEEPNRKTEHIERPLRDQAEIDRCRKNVLLSGAPVSVSTADKACRTNGAASKVQAAHLRRVRELQQGLITEAYYQDAFTAAEDAIEATTDSELKRLVNEVPELSRNVLVGSAELGTSLAAMLGLLTVEPGREVPATQRRSNKAVDDWEAEEERLEATEA
ncbi:hypothetical protein LTR36_004388 [Oleoguttula mirabilis]|uniref:J domain-containing protein n=1 Tax=Oleoguttula mirabilis TaxID=1507867 RepID=A0AAV9JG38_9PEZI|nr:hypothetical protein LTR36_004388 [Oleoguttula mirabilis]